MYIEAITAYKGTEALDFQLQCNVLSCEHKEHKASSGVTHIAIVRVEFLLYKNNALVHKSTVIGEGHDRNGKAVELAFKNAFNSYLALFGASPASAFQNKISKSKSEATTRAVVNVHTYNINEEKKHWYQLVHVGSETGVPIVELSEEARQWLFTEWLDSMKINGRTKTSRDKQLEKAVELCLLDLCEQQS